MMNSIKKYTIIILTICLVIGLWSCSELDDYKKYTKDGEVTYIGKIDSLRVYSGRNRVLVKGLFYADPKITEARIFWNAGKDSMSIPVTRTTEVDTFSVIVPNLEENIFNFEVRTYDQFGNSSLPVYQIGSAFGDRYQASLINRPIISSMLVDSLPGADLTVKYASMDLSTGVFKTELTYTNILEEEKTIIVPIDSAGVTITDYKGYGNDFKYQTFFLPEETSIDTFYTDFVTVTPNVKPNFLPIYVENGDFQLPGTIKQKNWNNVPGWNSDTTASDSGVEGSWNAFKMSTDPVVYNLTSHVIAANEEFQITFEASDGYNSSQIIVTLYYDSGDGVRNTLGTQTFDLGQTDPFELIVTATAASVGSNIGIMIDNVSSGGTGWTAFDNVKLFVK